MKYIMSFILSVLLISHVMAQSSWKIDLEELVVNKPPFKECHASTIVEGADGKILVAFFGGTGEGEKDVVIWQSFKEKGQWAAPTTIADGVMNDTLRYPCWNPVLFKEAAGKLFLFYKQGPKPFNWWGVFKTSDDNGKTWSPSENLPEGILGPIKNKPVLLNDGSILSPSSSEENGTWKVFMEKSSDHGKTWRLIPVDTGSRYRVIQPTILRYGQGHLQILCRSNQNKILQAWSKDNGNSWSSLTPTLLPNPNSGIDAVTLKSGWQMLVYNPTTKGKDWANGRQKLSVAVSQNGRQWKDVAVLENGTTEEFSYPAIIETDDGKVHITYTWDRKNIKHVVLAVTSK